LLVSWVESSLASSPVSSIYILREITPAIDHGCIQASQKTIICISRSASAFLPLDMFHILGLEQVNLSISTLVGAYDKNEYRTLEFPSLILFFLIPSLSPWFIIHI
jgi:hypothetical protein